MVSTNGSAGGVWQRPQYFDRQQLSAADLNAGLEYARQKARWHNRYLHGWGIVCGLRVARASAEDLWSVRVGEGYAVTPLGDEVYVPDRTFDIRPGVEACLGVQDDCGDFDTGGGSVRVLRASIDPPGRDNRTDYNVEWIDLCLLQPVNLNGFVIQHTINPGRPEEALVNYHRLSETGVLPTGSVVRVHSGSRLNDADPEPGMTHRYVADDTERGNWRLNNLRETIRVLDAAGAVQDTRSFLAGSTIPIDSGAVFLVVCPGETPECPQPGVPADCLPPGSNYQFSRVREGHKLEIVCERPAVYGVASPDCAALEATLCEGAPAPCPPAVTEDDNCVILASVQVLEGGIIVIDDLADRRQLVSQALIQDYLRCRCDEAVPVPPPPPTPTPPPPTPTPPPPTPTPPPPTPPPPPPPTRFTFFTFDPGGPTLFTNLPVTQFTQFTRFTDLTLFTDFVPFSEIGPFTDFRPIDPTEPVIPVGPIGPDDLLEPVQPVSPVGPVIVVPPGDPGFPIFGGGGRDFGFDRDAFDVELGRNQPPTAIEGIGAARAERLTGLGVRNVLEFAAMSSEVAAEVLNVSEVTVAAMQEQAREIMRR
jgi:hypothetical protein